MSCNYDPELLESMVLGELNDARADEVEAHVADCQTCAGELEWLRLELKSFEGRSRTTATTEDEREDLWDRISTQIEGSQEGETTASSAPARPASGRRPVLYFLSGFGAAAAAIVLWIQLGSDTTRASDTVTPSGVVAVTPTAEKTIAPATTSDQKLVAAKAALEKAENEYQNAIAALEATYKGRRHRLDPAALESYDTAMASSSTALRKARAAAGDDVDARLNVLGMYSSHLHTLQTVVTNSDM